ncbi:hypothetical protein [Actinoplanes sp. NPDC020271]|uniref:hypothetical protein n=1 Tax=Actinoplanes sp. NPDC020271 TaxID=3363896 RepID=UPI0037A469DC
MVDRPATHRVVCTQDIYETYSLGQAQRHRAAVQQLGGCRLPHIIEVRVDQQWVALHVVQAREILQASPGALMHLADGPLIKTSGGQPARVAGHARAADTTAEPDAPPGVVNPHENAVLTADGDKAHLDGWCACPHVPALDRWVRYERWTDTGRAGHGYLCPTCRRITQTG